VTQAHGYGQSLKVTEQVKTGHWLSISDVGPERRLGSVLSGKRSPPVLSGSIVLLYSIDDNLVTGSLQSCSTLARV
jgi:hypothetical protein